MATAFQKFFHAASHGHLPAAIPIVDEDGDPGMATMTIEVSNRQSARAMQMMFSENPQVRAAAAIYAVNYGMQEVRRLYDDITPAVG